MRSANITPIVFAIASSATLVLEASQPVDAIEGGGLVALGQGWIVEYRVDEVVEIAVERHDRLADMDELRRALADDVHAEHLARFAVEDQLQAPGGVAANLAACDLAVIR